MNSFKKLLRKELGESRYDGLVNFVNKYCGPEVKDNRELYQEIYDYCDGLDSEKIVDMQMRLNEVMFQAFQVGRTFHVVQIESLPFIFGQAGQEFRISHYRA